MVLKIRNIAPEMMGEEQFGSCFKTLTNFIKFYSFMGTDYYTCDSCEEKICKYGIINPDHCQINLPSPILTQGIINTTTTNTTTTTTTVTDVVKALLY